MNVGFPTSAQRVAKEYFAICSKVHRKVRLIVCIKIGISICIDDKDV